MITYGLIIKKRRAMARLIITRCFKSYNINAHIRTLLTVATKYDEEEMLRLLCEKGWDIHKQDGGGDTASITPPDRASRVYKDLAGRGQS